ncbi:MAG: rod shape-determining protein MreD [Betaproteobacteria bacterium]
MRRVLWTGLAIVGAALVETALGYLFPVAGRFLDAFLLVVVYCALSGGETHGMLAGVAAGWVQDVLFGGRVLGLAALSKLLVGFAVGLAGRRFLIAGTTARALTVFLASLADGLLMPWLASAFTLELQPQGPLALVGRAAFNALAGGALFALVDRRAQWGRP